MNKPWPLLISQVAESRDSRQQILSARMSDYPPGQRREIAEALSNAEEPRLSALWWIRVCRQQSKDRTAWYQLSNALRQSQRTQAAERILRALTAENPAWDQPIMSLAWLYRLRGEKASAIEVLKCWMKAHAYEPRTVLATSEFAQQMGATQMAEQTVRTAVAFRGEGSLKAELGNLLCRLGRFEEAEKVLIQALTRDPAQAGSWLRLAMIRRWSSPESSPLAFYRQALQKANLDLDTRTTIHFAMAKILDDLGLYSQAFEHAEKGNQLRLPLVTFNRTAWAQWEQVLYQVYTPEWIEKLRLAHRNDERAVFIVGMPRSGTTLLERRLALHHELYGVGELEIIEQAGLELCGSRPYPAGLRSIDATHLAKAAKDWRQRLPEYNPASLRPVDKNPFNFLHIGLILLILPKANIVEVKREIHDVAISNYFNHFGHARMNFAYSWENIAWMYGLYTRLMAFWKQRFPQQIIRVDYEQLISEPQPNLQRLCTQLDLEWDPAVLQQAEAGGSISTASLWQARQPIYAHATGRAKHYAQWLKPLDDALGRFAEEKDSVPAG